MPKTREQIKHDPVAKETWRDNRTQVGGLHFDPRKIRPLSDHIVVELDEEQEPSKILIRPEFCRNQEIGTRIGTVLAVGPGKLREDRKFNDSWMLNPLKRDKMVLKPGDRVVIGHYSDWESWASDFEGRARNVVVCQQNDVRLLEVEDDSHRSPEESHAQV